MARHELSDEKAAQQLISLVVPYYLLFLLKDVLFSKAAQVKYADS